MQNNFLFKKEENVFKWESDFLSLEFSDPSMQGFQEYAQLKSVEEIMHYYYTVKIYTKTSEYIELEDGSEKKLEHKKLVCEKETYDFPCIDQLKAILETILEENPTKNGQKISYVDGSCRYEVSYATSGFGYDDFYEVKKSSNIKGKKEQYVFYCGTSYEAQSDSTSMGIRTTYVNQKDMEELLACVNAFIGYSLEENNKKAQRWIDAIKIKDGKIYEYKSPDDESEIKSIFVEGDTVEIIAVVKNRQQEHRGFVIKKITDKEVYLSDNAILTIDSIAYINKEISDEELHYQEKEIVDEFYALLSQDEKEEFEKETVDFLFEKYGSAIIDRTAMCRNEHAFEVDYANHLGVKTIEPVLKDVIEMLKNK